MVPTTAFSGRNKSDDSLVVSMAILAVAYAVCQPVSLPRTAAPLLDMSWTLWNREPIERVMAVDEAATVLRSLRDVRFCTSSVGDVGVEAEISVGGFDLRKRGIMRMDVQINTITGLTSRMIDSVTTAPDITFFDHALPLWVASSWENLRDASFEVGMRGRVLPGC
jgi:hypothetical protein